MTIAEQLEQKGRLQGLEEGLEKGLEKGREEGRHQEALRIARMLLQEGVEPQKVSLITGIPLAALPQVSH